MLVHKCKCHGKPYSRCAECQCEYCPLTWCNCPRLPQHAPVTVLARYENYRLAIQYLASSHTTVVQRRDAIIERDRFEMDLRAGVFNAVFGY